MHSAAAVLRRKKGGYFEEKEGAPAPVRVFLKKRVNFNEADAMGIVWHGNYMKYFEEASAELGRKCGLSYSDYYAARIQAPIVQIHADYHQPSDSVEKINFESMEKVTKTIMATGWTLANTAKRPTVDKPLPASVLAGN